MTKLQAPDNCAGFTTSDGAFEVDEDGTIDVPANLVDVAKSHGFTDYVAPAPKKGKPAAEKTSTDKAPGE